MQLKTDSSWGWSCLEGFFLHKSGMWTGKTQRPGGMNQLDLLRHLHLSLVVYPCSLPSMAASAQPDFLHGNFGLQKRKPGWGFNTFYDRSISLLLYNIGKNKTMQEKTKQECRKETKQRNKKITFSSKKLSGLLTAIQVFSHQKRFRIQACWFAVWYYSYHRIACILSVLYNL